MRRSFDYVNSSSDETFIDHLVRCRRLVLMRRSFDYVDSSSDETLVRLRQVLTRRSLVIDYVDSSSDETFVGQPVRLRQLKF